MNKIAQFIRISRPLLLFASLLLYTLGAGVADYLGTMINWNIYFLGQIWILLILLSAFYLHEYFSAIEAGPVMVRRAYTGGIGRESLGELSRTVPLVAGFTSLAIAASVTVLIIQQAGISPGGFVFMLVFVGASLLLVVPPARLVARGYGEVTVALLLTNLIPALAFLFQTSEVHRLLAMATFPLTFLHLAMILAYELPDYGTDAKYAQQTLMVRAGWDSGMRLHNIFLLIAYLLLGLAMVLGMPVALGIPGFLTFPLAAFQIYLMARIAAGSRPNWQILLFVGAAIYWLTAYLITFALWTR